MSDEDKLFVGRIAQLKELEAHLQTALAGHGKVVFLVGEAGIGKTTLVKHFSESALSRYPELQYAYVQCDQIAGETSPYAPFIQLLKALTDQAVARGDHWAREFIREIGPDVLGLIPLAGPLLAIMAKSGDFALTKLKQKDELELGDLKNRFGQQDIFQQFSDTFRNIALKKNPLLLFVDDWHWADTSSTNLIFHMARQLADLPILFLATYRPEDAQNTNEERGHPILSIHNEMLRYHLCVNLSLDDLPPDDVATYLKARFPNAHFEPSLIAWLISIVDGNPFFMTEYINLLVEDQLLTADGHLQVDIDQVRASVPPSVEAVVRERIRRLESQARDALAYASVEGEQFTAIVLTRVLNLDSLSLIRKLRAIEETHRLIASLGQLTVYQRKTTVYRFVHALIHRALYNSLEEQERQEIGRVLLELLGEVYIHANESTKAQMAPQLVLYAAEAMDHQAGARYALDAANEAVKSYAHAEVLKHCDSGLRALGKLVEQTPDNEMIRIDLLLRRGDTEAFIGEWQVASQSYHQAERLVDEQLDRMGDKALLARAYSMIGSRVDSSYSNKSDYDRAMKLHRKSLASSCPRNHFST